MRNFLKLLSLTLCIALLCLSATACAKDRDGETKTDLTSLKWTDDNFKSADGNNSLAGTHFYVNANSDRLDDLKNPVTVKRDGSVDPNRYTHSAMRVNLADLNEQTAKAKKLVMRLSATAAKAKTPTESGESAEFGEQTKLTLKLDSRIAIDGGKNEVTLSLDQTPKTYEFDLTYENYGIFGKYLKSLIITAGAGRSSYETEITFHELYFSTEKPDGSLTVNERGNVDVPHIHDAKSDIFDIGSRFKTGGNSITLFSVGEETQARVAVSKTDWEFVYTSFLSDNLDGFKKLKVVFQAEKDVPFVFKIEGGSVNKEYVATATGELQSVTADDLTLEVLSGDTLKFVIFPAAGQTVEKAFDFTIKSVKLSK